MFQISTIPHSLCQFPLTSTCSPRVYYLNKDLDLTTCPSYDFNKGRVPVTYVPTRCPLSDFNMGGVPMTCSSCNFKSRHMSRRHFPCVTSTLCNFSKGRVSVTCMPTRHIPHIVFFPHFNSILSYSVFALSICNSKL